MRVTRLLIVCLFVPVSLLNIQTCRAQSVYGRITGTSSDIISGRPIRGAIISIASLSKGTKFIALTDVSGFYTLNDVPPDDYTLQIEANGYKRFQELLITVYADNTSQMKVRMVKGDTAEIVTGSAADVSILKLDRTDVSTILSRRDIADLPLQKQNVSRLELLAAGTVPVTVVLPDSQNPQSGGYIDVNGQRFSGTAYQLDGTDNRDPLEGIVVINPNQDAIGEMKITTQNYGAEFGEATAGVVTAQTRSGSNALHGTAFIYRQSNFGQASNPNLFTRSGTQIVPPVNTNTVFKRNDFGASLGGAFIKDRLFFFTDYRGTRDSSGATVHLTVPTAQVHTTCVGPPAATDCDLSQYGTAINPPYQDAGINSDGIPNNLLSPQTVHLLGLLPPPNLPGVINNFVATGREPFNSDAPDVRIDYEASQKVKFFGRYSIADFRQDGTPAFGPGGGPGTNLDTFAGRARTRNQEVSSGFSYAFNPGWLTDFRFGYLRYHLSLNAPDFGTFPLNLNSSAGILGLNTHSFSSDLPDIQIFGLPSNLGPTTTSDFVRFGVSPAASSCNCPLREREQQFQWVNNWIRLVGRHAIHWGGDFRYIQNFRLNSTVSRSGHFQFSSHNTGLSLGDFLIGEAFFFNRTYSDPTNPAAFSAGERQKRAFFYGEDTWRVTQRLTLNYGLRWELYFPQSVTSAGDGGFLLIHEHVPPSINSLITVAGRGGVNLQGNVHNTFKNFAPRLGLAYLLGSKTVIRAGYGRSFDVGYSGSLFGIAATQNPPVASVVRDNKGFLVNNPAGPFIATPDASLLLPTGNSFSVEQLCLLNNPTAAATCDPTNAANNSAPATDAALYALPARLRVPTVDAWNATVQRELSSNMYFELAYVGNKGTHVLTDGIYRNSGLSSGSAYDLNQPSEAGYIQTTSTVAPNPKCATTVIAPSSSQTGYCTTRQFARTLLTPWIAPLLYFGNSASSNYQSLQATFKRRFSGGVSVLAHYTFSRVQDYAPVYFSTGPRDAFGPGDFDRRHGLVTENIWALPVGHGRALLGNSGGVADKIIGGWSLSMITSWYSSLPFTPTYSSCMKDLGPGDLPCRPNVVGHVHITGNRQGYFPTSGPLPLFVGDPTVKNPPCGLDKSGQPQPGTAIGPWQRPGCGQIGNGGRNSLRGPGFVQGDVALMKEVALSERVSLRLRVDAFNAFNKVNLANPNPTVDSPQGGTITTLATGAFQRQFEFSAKLQF